MSAQARLLEGGFSDPVMESQAAFRAIMDAMARPGRIAVMDANVQPPPPLQVAAAAVVCTLCDHDTVVWLDPFLSDNPVVRGWIGFQTGAAVTEGPEVCAFAIVGDPSSMPTFDWFAQGSQEYPDRSTTLILQVPTLTGGQGLSLEGPGIDGRAEIAPRGLPGNFLDQWSANGGRFPRGVDLILATGDAIACLPRTVRISLAEG